MMIRTITLFLFVALLFTSTSCLRDRWINDEVVVDELARFLQKTHGGLATEISLQTNYLSGFGFQLPCNETDVTARIHQYSGEQRTANFTYNWIVVQTCVNEILANFNWQSSYVGTYGIPSVSGTAEGERNWVVTNLDSSFDEWILNGTAKHFGTQQSKVRERQSFESETEFTFTDLMVDKATGNIVGGQAISKTEITGGQGRTRVFDAVISFNENSLAAITMNGQVYRKILSN